MFFVFYMSLTPKRGTLLPNNSIIFSDLTFEVLLYLKTVFLTDIVSSTSDRKQLTYLLTDDGIHLL